jgi:hypothetical protein
MRALCRDPRCRADERIFGKSPRSGRVRIALGGADNNFAECASLTDANKSGGKFLKGEGAVDVDPYLPSDAEVGNRLEVGQAPPSLRAPRFGGAAETLSPSSSVEVRCIHSDGDCVVVEHSGRNEMPDDRRYDNNYCWVLCGL